MYWSNVCLFECILDLWLIRSYVYFLVPICMFLSVMPMKVVCPLVLKQRYVNGRKCFVCPMTLSLVFNVPPPQLFDPSMSHSIHSKNYDFCTQTRVLELNIDRKKLQRFYVDSVLLHILNFYPLTKLTCTSYSDTVGLG